MYTQKSSGTLQAGFGLVEIMIAMLIGLLTTLAIMQTMSVFEGQKRTTSGTADAQTTGALALYKLQQFSQMAGFGLPIYNPNYQPTECAVAPVINDALTGWTDIGMLPLEIADGGGGQSDSITIRYASNNPLDATAESKGGIPMTVNGAAGATLTVATNMGCKAGDVALLMENSPGSCAMARVIGAPAGGTTIALDMAIPFAKANDKVSCLGNWVQRTYATDGNGNLTENGAIVNGDIVNLQAQYGLVDAGNVTGSNVVTAWVDATGVWAPAMLRANPVQYKQIKAVRIAVVARNPVLEKEPVAQSCATGPCSWKDPGLGAPPAIDLTADPDWMRYRYRVFETIIPVRNMVISREAMG